MALATGCPDDWSWNKLDEGPHVKIWGDKSEAVHFHPVWTMSTVAVRGTRILNGGQYYWEIETGKRLYGTSIMFGIGTEKARMSMRDFVNLLGADENSWGLNHRGVLWHKNKSRCYTDSFEEDTPTRIGLYFNGLEGTLSYYKDGKYLGIAFSGLDKIEEPLFPMLSSSAARIELRLSSQKRAFHSLQDRCRLVILSQLKAKFHVEKLPVPPSIKEFLLAGPEQSEVPSKCKFTYDSDYYRRAFP